MSAATAAARSAKAGIGEHGLHGGGHTVRLRPRLERDAGAERVDACGVVGLIGEQRQHHLRDAGRQTGAHGAGPAVGDHRPCVRHHARLRHPALDVDVRGRRAELRRVAVAADRDEDAHGSGASASITPRKSRGRRRRAAARPSRTSRRPADRSRRPTSPAAARAANRRARGTAGSSGTGHRRILEHRRDEREVRRAGTVRCGEPVLGPQPVQRLVDLPLASAVRPRTA